MGLTKRDVAVKTLKGIENVQNMVTYSSTVYAGDFDQDEVDTFVEESLKMGRFKHAHVMGLIGVCLDAGSAPYIIMPYMANGSLLKYLKKERKNIVLSEEADEDEVMSLCTDYGEFHWSNFVGWYIIHEVMSLCTDYGGFHWSNFVGWYIIHAANILVVLPVFVCYSNKCFFPHLKQY